MVIDYCSSCVSDESFSVFLIETDGCDAIHLFEAISKLSANELLRFSLIESKKRKREFLLSRFLVVSSFLNFYQVENYSFLSVDKKGKPFFGVSLSEEFHYSVSLSHAEGVLALGVYRQPIYNYVQSIVDVGIDVQPLGSVEVPEAFIRFLRIPRQLKLENLYASQYLEQLTMRWVLAEACLKAAGGKASDIRDIAIKDDVIRMGFRFTYPNKMQARSTTAWCYIHRGVSCCVVATHTPVVCEPILYYSDNLVRWETVKAIFALGGGSSI